MKEHHWSVSAALLEQMLGTRDLGRSFSKQGNQRVGVGGLPGNLKEGGRGSWSIRY